MATTATPLPGGQRPNIPTAAVRFPAVRDYEQVDREIAGTLRPTLGWFAALGIAILCLLIGASTLDLPDPRRPRRGGLSAAGDVGRLHHHLRVLGRYRPRRHADLGDSVSVPRRIPNEHLPRVGSDDGVRRHDGRTVPDPAPRPAVEVLLSDPVSELAAHLAESKEPAGVGRVRDPHVPHDLEHLPLHRVDSGHRDPARPREESGSQGDPRACSRSAGGTRIANGGTSRARTCSSPRSRRRSCSRCTRSCRSTSRWR